jgi:hemolysin III
MEMRINIRELFSGLSHLGGAAIAAFGLVVLLILGRDNLMKEISLLIYGTSLVLMFLASATFHLVHAGPRLSRWLHNLDHTSIFLLIAGTYTPICMHFFDGFWKWGFLTIVWSIAGIGITARLTLAAPPYSMTAIISLLMGWLSVLMIWKMIQVMPVGALLLLLIGGLFFTLGAVIFMIRKPNFHPEFFDFHDLWHVFVILGCLSHFIVVAIYVAAGPSTM